MHSDRLRIIIVLTVVLLMSTSGLPSLLGSPGGDGGLVGGGFAPMDVGPWVDDFLDSSKVNFTQNTVVTGGHVELAAGQAAGLVASAGIHAPLGYRYDMLLLEVMTPGTSTVMVSVLNATEDSTKVGYVNEPIPGFLKLDGTQIPLTSIDPIGFPEIRLQADLEAGGTDRPQLLRWSVLFLPGDMWRDEFLGDGKVQDSKRVVFTGSTVEVDLSRKNTYAPGYGDYAAYPPLIVNRYSDQNNRLEMGVYYPTPTNDDYQGRTQVYAENPRGFVAGDLDQDGFLDMVVANYRDGNDYTRNSWIMWGDPSGTWDIARRADLATDRGRDAALGDVNGDGYLDVLICCGGGTGEVRVFLNPGNRTFSNTHDIALPGSDLTGLASLDLNGDDYDDVVMAEEYSVSGSTYSRAYFGGPGGPDTNPDKLFPTGTCYEVALDDFDKDGYVDVVFANTVSISGTDYAQVFYGGANGPDETADFTPQIDGTQWGLSVATGDVNGDGWPDLVYGRVMMNARMYVWWGGATGFSNTRTSNPTVNGGSIYDVVVIDVNKDGTDDVIGADQWGGSLSIYFSNAGGIDGNRDKTMDTNSPNAIGVGAGKKRYDYIMGSFLTNPINRPLDKKWDVLVVDGNVPANTEMEITVLDSGLKPVLGYDGLAGPDVDLGGIDVPTIHVRVTLKSLDMMSTPSIDTVFVNWMDKNIWRDQFYGAAKVNKKQGLTVSNGQLTADPDLVGEEELIFSNLRSDSTFNVPSLAFRDGGGLDYLAIEPMRFRVPSGAGAVKATDINGDGFLDVMFAVTQTSDSNFMADSPLFLGSPVGFDSVPNIKFPTKGARDVLVADLNADGFKDVVFAQEREVIDDFVVNSTLFWGSATGWKAKPDVEFTTTGASGVVAADFDKDGKLDLAFACFRDTLSTAINSMVFLQKATGFNGSSADVLLSTRGARDVAAGDIDGDGWVDLVFANSLGGGFVEINSYVYWGGGSGFGGTPSNLATQGAEGVAVADLNGDGDMDVVFANSIDNSQNRQVYSFVYMGDGSRSMGPTADFSLPTLGATSVAVADLDGTGWKDLVFSCQNDGATFEVNSRGYLGGTSGYGGSPDLSLPTFGASDVAVAHIVAKDAGGYLSRVISPGSSEDAGVFHTFRYDAVNLPAGHTGTIQVLDATTGVVLAETSIVSGLNEWILADEFRIREHPAIFVKIVVQGLDPVAGLAIDDLWLNWTARTRASPIVLDMAISASSVLRTKSVTAWVNATDEYDYKNELKIRIEHRKSGSADPWATFMVSGLTYQGGTWRATLAPRVDLPVGVYDFRAKATDSDLMESEWLVLTEALEVINNIPTAPVVRIDPVRAIVTTQLRVEFVTSATDVESPSLTYFYQWFLDGEMVADLTTNQVPTSRLLRGQVWSVEVRAYDGDDLGPPGSASKDIVNAPPLPIFKLVDPEMYEDTTDNTWTNLMEGFGDPDGDSLTFRVDPPPQRLEVTIDPVTGVVTYKPIKDWWGTEVVTFWASDGEFEVNQSVKVIVTAVNDAPYFVTVAGKPYTGEPIYMEVDQDEKLVIEVLAFDVEGNDLLFRVSNNLVHLDLTTGWMDVTPTNDNVGWLNFSLTVNDNVDTNRKMYANFTVRVLNVNDPVDVPRIISPTEGATYKWNESVGLRGVCTDPDEKHGQELIFSWKSNISGDLGFGPNLNYRFTKSGHHLITLTVSDGETSQEITINITVGAEPLPPPPPPPPEDDEGLSMALLLGIVLAVIVAVVLIAVLAKRRKVEEEEVPPALTPEEERRQHLAEVAAAVKATADQWEAERDAGRAERPPEAGEEGIEIAGTGMLPSSTASHQMRLSEQASDETAKLWADMEKTTHVVDDAEKDALRKETEKRKIVATIKAMPYGIPAPELRHLEPEMLADEMVNASRTTLDDGHEIVSVRGKWYFNDPEDMGSFLKQYKMKDAVGPSADRSEWEEA